MYNTPIGLNLLWQVLYANRPDRQVEKLAWSALVMEKIGKMAGIDEQTCMPHENLS